MAVSANTAWEVRPVTGSDINGGGFVAGATGTDWSQQTNPQYNVVDGVTAGTTTITSGTANFGTDVVGNIMYVTGGTGNVVAAWYQITVRNSATSITVDRSTGLTTGTGVTLRIGGALRTITQAATNYVASNKIFVKAEGAITTTASFTFATSTTPTNAAPAAKVIGYTSARNDKGIVSIVLSTSSGLTGLNATGTGVWFDNFNVNCSSLATSVGITLNAYCRARNCKVSNFINTGINMTSSDASCSDCEVTGGTSGGGRAILLGGTANTCMNCYVHDNVCAGIRVASARGRVIGNLVTNNTGSPTDGIQIADTDNTLIIGNTVYGSGQDGINYGSTDTGIGTIIKNNILANNGRYGLNFSIGAGTSADRGWDGNAYYSNTTANRNNVDDTTTNTINGVSPYTNTLDIVITAGTPFTSASTGDFTLNNIVNQGTAIRGHGIPGSMPGLTQTGFPDMGVFQHSNPSINRGILTGGNL
jgi:hypothetical protein